MKKKRRNSDVTRAHILDAAFLEIYRHGYHGVGVRNLAAKADVTIGAFFHHFPTKNHVVYAIVEEIIRPGILQRWITPLSEFANPLEGIVKCFKDNFDAWSDELVALGCPLNNLTQELSSSDASVKEKTAGLLYDWIDQTQGHLLRAREGGYLKETVDVRELAEFIVSFQEGTFAIGKALNDRKIFDSMYHSFKLHIESVSA